MTRPFLALGALFAGCYSAGFVCTDAQFKAAPAQALPSVYCDHKPERAYRGVGYVRVEADPVVSEATIRKVAAAQGQHAGCDLLVDARLTSTAMFKRLRWRLGAAVLTAHEEGHGKEASSSGSSSGGKESAPSAGSSGAAYQDIPNSPVRNCVTTGIAVESGVVSGTAACGTA